MKITKDRLILDICKKDYKPFRCDTVKSMLKIKDKVKLKIHMPKDLKVIYDNNEAYLEITRKSGKIVQRDLAMPKKENTVGYYMTIFHELIHNTAPELDRPMGSQAYYAEELDYDKEELVAEMGSLLMLEYFGILNIRSYVKGLKYIRVYMADLLDIDYPRYDREHGSTDDTLQFAFEQAERARDYLLKQIL